MRSWYVLSITTRSERVMFSVADLLSIECLAIDACSRRTHCHVELGLEWTGFDRLLSI